MKNPPRVLIAPLLDAAIIFAFVATGKGHHDIDEGFGWYFTVLWPLAVGWFGVALLTRLYTRDEGIWKALTITFVAGLTIMCVLRGTFTDRPYFGIFTIVGAGFIGLLAYGWRAVFALWARRRAAPAGA